MSWLHWQPNLGKSAEVRNLVFRGSNWSIFIYISKVVYKVYIYIRLLAYTLIYLVLGCTNIYCSIDLPCVMTMMTLALKTGLTLSTR